MKKKPIKFPDYLNLSLYEKKIYNSNLKNFLKNRPKQFVSFYKKVRHLSMSSKERLYNIFNCLNYIKVNNVKGDIAEIGIYKGANLALCRKFSNKKIYGFDTFEGHQKPNINEQDIWAVNQYKLYNKKKSWCKIGIEEVEKNIKKISSFKNIQLIKGKVQNNKKFINKIKKVSLLIIDVDWYEPTLFSLKNLYHKVSKGGFIIINDFGHHSGSKHATKLFFKNKKKIKFYNIDYSCIVMQKQQK